MTIHRSLVSVICPAYHEQEVLPHFHSELSQSLIALESKYRFEILYVDDGSRDGTMAAMNQIASGDPRVRVLSFARNFGKEAALQAGLEYAQGEFIVTMDTDLQHPPELIGSLLKHSEEAVDLVVAVREDYHKPSWFHQFATQTFYRILGYMSEIEIRKDTSDYLLMTRKIRTILLEMREKHRFMKGLIHWMGFAYKEVPFRPKERVLGTTKFSLKQLLALGRDCLYSFSKKPLTLATNAGMLVLAVGAVWSLAALATALIRLGDVNWLFHYLIVSSHVIGGAILLSVGVLGEYVGRIWEQVRDRPSYLLKYDSESVRDSASLPVAGTVGPLHEMPEQKTG